MHEPLMNPSISGRMDEPVSSATTTHLLRAAFWLAAIGVVAISITPGTALPPVPMWDKLQHFLAYAVLALLGWGGYRQRPVQVALGLILLGGALELAQIAVPGPSASGIDGLANAIGAALGTGLSRLAPRLPA